MHPPLKTKGGSLITVQTWVEIFGANPVGAVSPLVGEGKGNET